MNLPPGIKHAVHMGANEAFLEWTCDPTEAALAHLGASYQDMGEGICSPEDATQYVADLAAWDDGTLTGAPAARFETLMCRAGVELARGMIAEAASIGTVPDRAKPYMHELAPLVAALKSVLAGGPFDEESLAEMIWT